MSPERQLRREVVRVGFELAGEARPHPSKSTLRESHHPIHVLRDDDDDHNNNGISRMAT
jgi:hypothetical protein